MINKLIYACKMFKALISMIKKKESWTEVALEKLHSVL